MEQIYVDVSPVKDESPANLFDKFELSFSEPISGEWLLDVVFGALKRAKRESDKLGAYPHYNNPNCS